MLTDHFPHLIQQLIGDCSAQLASVDDKPLSIVTMMCPKAILRTNLMRSALSIECYIKQRINLSAVTEVHNVI